MANKVIILIGKTGSGKSTLANVISGTNKFKESGATASVTKEIQKEDFTTDSGISYAVIDTVGIGDTQLKKEEVLDKIADAVYLARNGISQILFVTNGRFDQFEMSTYNLLRTIIFDQSVTDYTTIVRTKFPEFESKDKLQKDIEKLLTSEGELSNIIKTCQQRIIHIDNPSLDIVVADDESDGEREEREIEIESKKRIRSKSQKKVLGHLIEYCQKQENYTPEKLSKLSAEISEYMERKLKKREELIEKKKKLGLETKKEEVEKKKKNESENILLTDNNDEIESVDEEERWRNEEQEISGIDNKQVSESKKKIIIKSRIRKLEEEIEELEKTKKLIEEIQQTDGSIRQRVLKHIFNNIKDITQVTGGDIFINSIVSDNSDIFTNKLSLTELQEQREILEQKLLEQKSSDQSLEQIETKLSQKERRLLDLKKQLLTIKEISEEWQKQGFSIQQVNEWADSLGNSFDPEADAPFCAWIRDKKKITTDNIGQLRKEYAEQYLHNKLNKEEDWERLNNPIKLQDNLYLYSGDIITINNSNPLLVEIIEDEKDKSQTTKLRNVKDDKYLSKRWISKTLDFSTNFENALIFTVKNDNGKISLQTDDNKYLKLDGRDFRLSSKEKSLTITKQQNTENIADYEEMMEIISLHEEKGKEISSEQSLTVRDFYDNKSENPSKHTFKFTESKQKEHNFTWSNDLTLEVSTNFKLGYSGTEVGIAGQFEKKIGTSNTITKIDTTTTEKNLEFICPPWKKMRVVSEIKKTKLLIPYTASVKRLISRRVYEYSIDGEYFCEESLCHNSFNEEITTRNILLFGCTGSGKSTLAKVLSGDNRFEESSGSVSKTRSYKKSEEFEWEGSYYCVIDNIGFGDTKISEKEELIRIGEAINSARHGLNHVLFVFDGRFFDKEKEGFHKLAALKITNSYITLVRSKFDNFGNKGACERDKEALEKESSEISQVFDNCRGLLYINNGDDRSRNKSRKKVLDYLHNNTDDEPFKPKEWEDISILIDSYLREKTKLENEKNQADIDQKEAIEQQIDNLKTNTAEQVKEKVKEREIREFIEVIEVAKNNK